jgi:hypothetical protein
LQSSGVTANVLDLSGGVSSGFLSAFVTTKISDMARRMSSDH